MQDGYQGQCLNGPLRGSSRWSRILFGGGSGAWTTAEVVDCITMQQFLDYLEARVEETPENALLQSRQAHRRWATPNHQVLHDYLAPCERGLLATVFYHRCWHTINPRALRCQLREQRQRALLEAQTLLYRLRNAFSRRAVSFICNPRGG